MPDSGKVERTPVKTAPRSIRVYDVVCNVGTGKVVAGVSGAGTFSIPLPSVRVAFLSDNCKRFDVVEIIIADYLARVRPGSLRLVNEILARAHVAAAAETSTTNQLVTKEETADPPDAHWIKKEERTGRKLIVLVRVGVLQIEGEQNPNICDHCIPFQRGNRPRLLI